MIHMILNLLLPPFGALLVFFILLPLRAIFKSLSFVWRSIFIENVKGKVVLITGAASGIGEQLAYEYASRGARLALVDIKEDNLRKVVERSTGLGSPHAVAIHGDVSKQDDCKRFIDHTIQHFGQLNHLVCNAGFAKLLTMIPDVTDISSLNPVMDINFWGTVHSIHFAVPHLRQSRGKIIVMASCNGWLPTAHTSIYNASKAALIHLCETLRIEIGPDVGITTVTPGLIKTEMTQGEYSATVPVGRVLPSQSAENCAKAIFYGACRGDRYLAEPSWIGITYLVAALCPEVVTWSCGLFYAWGSKQD